MRFIHIFALSWMVILHFRLVRRWIRYRYFYHRIPAACPEPAFSDSLQAYPDIYCIMLDAFGHPDTLSRHLSLRFFYPDTLQKTGFLTASLSLDYYATFLALYHFFFSPDSPKTKDEIENHINQIEEYDILARATLPPILRQKGYHLKGPLPIYYFVQSLSCFDFHSQYNVFSMSLPYSTRWTHYVWHYLVLRQKPHIPAQEQPTFYYYHLLTSHWPYVFDLEGRYNWSTTDNLYRLRQSFEYTEKILLEIIACIHRQRQGNPRPYAILIFSDHGPYEMDKSPYRLSPEVARALAYSAFAALYTSWTLPDTTREAFCRATRHYDLGRVLLELTNPVLAPPLSTPSSRTNLSLCP